MCSFYVRKFLGPPPRSHLAGVVISSPKGKKPTKPCKKRYFVYNYRQLFIYKKYSMQTITIENPEITLSKNTFATFGELFSETQTNSDEPDGVLHEMSYDELTPKQKQTVQFLKNTELSQLNLVNF